MDDGLDLSWLDDAMNSSAFVGGESDLSYLDGFGSYFADNLGSLTNNININDLINKSTVGFGTEFNLNPSQSRDLYSGINFEKMSDVGEFNDIAAGGKVTAEEAVRSGNALLAGTIITPQEAMDYGIDVNTLLPVASDIMSPALAKIYEDFGLSSTGAASGVVDPNIAKLINETNKLVTGSPELSKTGAIYPSPGGGGVINKTETINKVQEIVRNLTGGKDNAALLAALLGGLLGLTKSQSGGKTVGYQGKTGSPMTATRTALPTTGAPGAGGKRFLSDVTYAAEGGLMDIVSGQPNQNVTFMAGGGLPSQREYFAGTRGLRLGDDRNYDRLVGSGYSIKDALDFLPQVANKEMARGGLSSLGSYSDGGRMLKGPGDGMSDSIPASIEGKRPARLANDEFVVPADVVSHLGNGSSDAGAKVLYDMMAKVRKARTGKQSQGKQINPKNYVPS